MSSVPSSTPLVRILALALVSAAAAAPSPSFAQVTPQMRSEALSLMQICHGDYELLCTGVLPGGGRILACLQRHGSQLSAACAQAMPRAEALKDSAIAGGVLPK